MALLRQQSLDLLSAAGPQLSEMVRAKRINLRVSRPLALEFFLWVNPTAVREATGYDLGVATKVVKFLVLRSSLVLLVSAVVLSFVTFGWWGAIAIILAPLAYAAAIRGAVKGGGVASWLLLGSLGAFFFAAKGTSQHMLAAAIGLWALNLLYYYELAASQVESAALRGPAQLLRVLIDRGAVVLEKGTSLK